MLAITRDVSPNIHLCELTHLDRAPIDYTMAATEERDYRRLLSSLGLTVVTLPGDPAHPDCVFIEDTAVVLPELAVITRPGAPSRRGETRVVAGELQKYRPLVHIEAPATLDGGDVLILDDRLYVGLSARTNEAAIGQLRYHTRRDVIPVPVHGCLHLKSAVTRVAGDALLIQRDWIDAAPFAQWTLIDVDPSEPFAANTLKIGDAVVYPDAFPKTRARLEARGIDVRTVRMNELAKAEGGVTCCSLIV
ncbi:MAG TPA: dimethylargininase [Thermoanaerobaculia bacterium]|nr:dimethylargininase [Thermoanaerobaculia bacterium]